MGKKKTWKDFDCKHQEIDSTSSNNNSRKNQKAKKKNLKTKKGCNLIQVEMC